MASGGKRADSFPAMTWEEKFDAVEMLRKSFHGYPSRTSWKTVPIGRDALARLRSTGIEYDGEVRERDLGVWCYRQRMAKIGKGDFTITDDQIRTLTLARFDWNPWYDSY
jgi:hypothetical protein